MKLRPRIRPGKTSPFLSRVLGATGRTRPVQCHPAARQAVPIVAPVDDGRHWSSTTSGTQNWFLNREVITGLFFRMILGVMVALAASSARGDFVSTFEDVGVPANSFINNVNGAASGFFTSGGSTFNNNYSSTFGSWSGWAISSKMDTTTAGFGNQYSAITGTGGNGSPTYGVAYDFSPNASFINLAAGSTPVSMQITNTTYAYLSMLNGDQFAKKFGAGDFFLLTINGYSGSNATGSTIGSPVNFYLANFLGSNASIVNTWQTLNLSSLAGSKSLGFTMTSSDVGQFGINTPTYFAADNLDLAPLTAVPEPSSVLLVAIGAGVGLIFQARRALMSQTHEGVRQ